MAVHWSHVEFFVVHSHEGQLCYTCPEYQNVIQVEMMNRVMEQNLLCHLLKIGRVTWAPLYFDQAMPQ